MAFNSQLDLKTDMILQHFQ